MLFHSRGIVKCVIAWLAFFNFISSMLHAQNLIVANSANILDAKSSFINPAIQPFQVSQLLLGMQVYHVGFLENDKFGFRNNYFSLTSPYIFNKGLVLGMMGQYFGLPIYRQSLFSFTCSNKFNNKFAIGVKYNIITHAYDRSNFDQVNEFDPVFANGAVKTSHSFGFGLLITPMPNLDLGFAWDHINRPNVALMDDGISQPYLIDFGLKYTYKFISTSINMNFFQDSPIFSLLLESRFPDKGIIRVGYETKSAKFEGEIDISNGLALNYSYSYPLYEMNDISTGSHQVSLIYDFHYLSSHFMKGKKIFSKERRFPFTISLDCDQLEIINKNISRTFDKAVTTDKIDNLCSLEAGIIDSSRNDETFFDPDFYYHDFLEDEVLNPKISEAYGQKLNNLSNVLNYSRDKKITVFHKDMNNKRVDQIKKVFSPVKDNRLVFKEVHGENGSHSVLTHEQYEKNILILFPRIARFKVKNIMQKYHGFWKIEITDYTGKIVKMIERAGHLDSEIMWDWKDEQGNLLTPDEYYYVLYWNDENGKLKQTKKKSFQVVNIIRHLNVEISTKPKTPTSKDIEYKIKLHN